MSRLFSTIIAVAVAASVPGGSWAGSSDENFEIVDVSPSVVMAQNPSGSNLTCIALDDGLVFVDTGLDTEAAAEFRKDMQERFDRPTKFLILTHAHIDHIFAMGAFKDVDVVAAAAAKPLFEYQLTIEWDEKSIAGYSSVFPTFAEAQKTAEPFLPTIWVEDSQDFGSAENRIVFANTGGHSAGSSYVYFPSENVLVAGDLVQVGKYPYFGDRTTDLGAWIDTLKLWHGMDPAKICPGHGWVVDKDYLLLESGYFEDLIEALAKMKSDGVPEEEAVVHTSLPAGYWDENLPEPGWFKYCIALSYRSL